MLVLDRPSGFPAATAACVAVLQRAADPEESVRDLVAKVFQGLWFSNGAASRLASMRLCDVFHQHLK